MDDMIHIKVLSHHHITHQELKLCSYLCVVHIIDIHCTLYIVHFTVQIEE